MSYAAAPPMKRVRNDEVTNPCSGCYEGGDQNTNVQLIVDIDRTARYTKSLGMISGTISGKNGGHAPWSVRASMYFKIIPATLEITGGQSNERHFKADMKAAFSNGVKIGGKLSGKLYLNASSNIWSANVDIEVNGQKKVSFKNVSRSSKFFKEVKLDIDYTEKLIWPTVNLRDLRDTPGGIRDRKLDPFSAFEDAGLKLLFDQNDSEKVEDPTPHDPWTKGDLYEVMMTYFDESEESDENIWCMLGTIPPDKRFMGFSFDRKGRRGFGLFTKHRAFEGLDASCPRKRAQAHRRLLHYLVHECGHCLGLKHPFEIGADDSLSWMNYAYRYDIGKEPGSFYGNFKYSFSDQELMILRHSPSKVFRAACTRDFISSIMGSGYNAKSEAPDAKLADDDDDIDTEKPGYGKENEPTKPKPNRKIDLHLKVPRNYCKGELLSFEARLKNVGKLPALIEGDLSLESGNLQLYVTKPDGTTQAIESFVRPIYSGYSKPKVLYTPEDEEGPDRYSEMVTVGEGSEGYQVDMPGIYKVRAVYSGGRYKVTSETYSINVEEDDEDDDETKDEIVTAATLQASSYDRFQKTLDFWKRLESQSVEKKKSKVATLIAFFDGLARGSTRKAKPPVKKRKRGRKQIDMETGGPPVSRAQALKDTSDLIQYYQTQGAKSDNMDYSSLVLARGKLYMAEKNTKDADAEFNRMMNDLLTRGVKYDILSKLTKRHNKMKNPPKTEEKYTSANLQGRVNKVLTWAPTTAAYDETDLSGVGLGKPFSNFDYDQIEKASKIMEILFTKYDETQDLNATIGYADKLQKGREVNNMVLRWALEAFIVHSMDAKNAGIKYPEPEDRDESLYSNAAMMVTRREGLPQEQWMNYWRCDADFNYHHRHWHVVYVASQFLRHQNGRLSLDGAPAHLKRQGELFGYMHSQMLARYDAERESWGLKPVQPWQFHETSTEFNAGLEFHNDQQWQQYVPRPKQEWPARAISTFKTWESAYDIALETGVAQPDSGEEVELTPDRAGHILEPSTGMFRRKYGSYHNAGHGVFGSTGMPHWATSYMNDTATAVRDLIFYRWHRRIDTLWIKNNEFYRTEIAHDAPPITITADDIVLSTDANPPKDFSKWSYGSWAGETPDQVACLHTYLGPAKKKYEWDNKLSHEKFYYHIRIKRNADSPQNQELPLTLRIFICPKKVQADRRRWIEMDKFVCKIPSGEDHISLTRADVHSSVIKRLHENMRPGKEPDSEMDLVKESQGFCECGWPYTMLLPRGKKDGEEYVVFVMATDNKLDSIGIRTSCGSMSYCGARGQDYPDSRTMGYPFVHPITFKGQELEVPGAFDMISNAAYKTFTIENNIAEPPPFPAKDIWFPFDQLAANDGTLRRPHPGPGVAEYVQSELVGTFRVLVDNEYCLPSPPGNPTIIRFEGRGPGGGSYVISDVHFSLRNGETVQISKEQNTSAKVSCGGQVEFVVPECGILSDPVNLSLDPAKGDYFITFTVNTPGTYLPSRQKSQTSTYFLPASVPTPDLSEDWNVYDSALRRFAYIQCVSAVMVGI